MRRSAALICAASVVCGVAVACSRTSPPAQVSGPAVVASTDVWGSVASAVAAGDARVTSIVNGQIDPHSYEPSPAAVAQIEDAALAVYNGGGYDAWVDDILNRYPDVAAVDAFALLKDSAAASGPPNEHVFYDVATAKAVAARIADLLAAQDNAHADGYRSRAADFGHRTDEILERQRGLRIAFPGANVIATEPVAHYLLVAAGLTDRTPAGFSNAIEQDSDPSPADMAAVLDLINGRQVSVVVVNEQTLTGATRQVRDAAVAAGVPIVSVTETLPAGTDYLSWQSAAVDRLAAALRESR